MRAQVAVIEIEALLGLWLLSGFYPGPARWAALAVFCMLACASLYLGVVGESSCGCFGRVPINPWMTFAIDSLALLGLCFWRLPRQFNPSAAPRLRAALKTVAGTVAILCVMGGAFVLTQGNPASALARLRGEYITVEPAVTEVGAGVRGERREFIVQLVNHSEQPIQCMGGSASCHNEMSPQLRSMR